MSMTWARGERGNINTHAGVKAISGLQVNGCTSFSGNVSTWSNFISWIANYVLDWRCLRTNLTRLSSWFSHSHFLATIFIGPDQSYVVQCSLLHLQGRLWCSLLCFGRTCVLCVVSLCMVCSSRDTLLTHMKLCSFTVSACLWCC